MDEQRPTSVRLLVLLIVAAAAALYGTLEYKAEVEARLTLAAQTEKEVGAATRMSERILHLRSAFSGRGDKNERMLISFIEETATRNRVSLASLTIDPGTLKDASRVNRFYKEVDTVVRLRQAPLKDIILFLAEVQTQDPGLEPRLLSLMPSESDRNAWDARVTISYFVYDEETPPAGLKPPGGYDPQEGNR